MRNLSQITTLGAAVALTALAASADAAQVYVYDFGHQGWKADDVRNTSGTDLVGINSTHAGKPGQAPTGADDTAIAGQLQFVAGPAGST